MALFRKGHVRKKSNGDGLFTPAKTSFHKRHGAGQVHPAGFPTSEDGPDAASVQEAETVAMFGDRVQLASSNLAWCEYDQAARALRIGFHSGQSWSYAGVPEHVAISLIHAASPGAYFASDIRDRYAATRLA